jgi:hypothetical protein
MKKFDIPIKVILIIGLALAILKMPYQYYEILRVVNTILFAFLAIRAYNVDKYLFIILYIFGSIIFNPFISFTFKKQLWQWIDVLFILILIISLILNKRSITILRK